MTPSRLATIGLACSLLVILTNGKTTITGPHPSPAAESIIGKKGTVFPVIYQVGTYIRGGGDDQLVFVSCSSPFMHVC